MTRRLITRTVGIVALAMLTASCGRQAGTTERPNVLWIIWDTVRADRLSLYGHQRQTTPFLDRWAEEARVFDDCVSTAGSTVPSHASMFTGLLPSEHGTHNKHRRLDPQYTTLAELLQSAGYQTYLFSANPHIQHKMGFAQGFDVHEHPWSPKYRQEAIRIVEQKTQSDRSSLLPHRLRSGDIKDWYIKASGELAQRGLTDWLEERDRSRPFFAFLNYMEAHTPYIPPRSFREKMMSPEQVDRSYTIDNSHISRWAYTFGLSEQTPQDLEVLGAVYDAALLELDTLFRQLMTDLAARGHLENTVVVLASDHGEHLGEHHMLDHQYALYEPIVRVPLILHDPARFPAGRDASPVVTFDIFPTILELCGVDPPAGLESQAASLTAPREQRSRMAEYPVVFEPAIRDVGGLYPDWDPTPWRRRLRSFYDGEHKLICASDDRHELYDLASDPQETRDLYAGQPELAGALMQELQAFAAGLTILSTPTHQEPVLTEEEKRMLISLGYLPEDGIEEESPETEPSSSGACGF